MEPSLRFDRATNATGDGDGGRADDEYPDGLTMPDSPMNSTGGAPGHPRTRSGKALEQTGHIFAIPV